MYKLLRNLLFLLPAESVHYFSMNVLKLLCSVSFIKKGLAKLFNCPAGYEKSLFGLQFRNPVGLAAGFDKNARYLDALETLGFGFVEIGTVTPLAQAGNPKPRLFRLPKDRALINRMGFNNDGVKTVAARLKEWRASKPRTHAPRLLVGGNIGKNKQTSNEDAWKDYDSCFRELFDCVDYFVVNVSSPNTPGLRALQEKEALKRILLHLQTINAQQVSPKPLLLKIAPDLTVEQLDDVIDLATEIKLDGLVAANTTISRENLLTPQEKIQSIGMGGVSGKPLTKRATDMVRYISKRSNDAVPVIASGGIFTAADATEKTEAGAALLQVWTGFIYEGPRIVKNLLCPAD
ncbi:MAG: quinone-dependent dihydroorotate dehydrogenase [Williamsia sp.]|nr:quinone-dependent dihydroorotate dehydrogenase [Williamsia sp.]